MDDRMDELLSELPPQREEPMINPWRRPVFLLLWGILLTTVTLDFLYLDMILPAVGGVLMYLGLRSLRRENTGFKTAWILSTVRLALTAVGLAAAAVPFRSPALNIALFFSGAVLQIWQAFAIRSGLGRIFDRAGAERRLGAMNWLIAFQFLLAAGGLMNIGNLGVLGLGLIFIYLGVVIALFKLPRAIADTGFALRNAPVRLGDRPAAAVMLTVFAAVTAAAYFGGIALSVPPSEPFTPSSVPELSDRIPEDVAELLSPEEAALFEDAIEIRYKRREPGTYPDGTVIEFGTAVAELPGQRLLILQSFRYLEGAPRYGDGFICSQSDRLSRTVRPDTGSPQPTGALVYEQKGETRRSSLRNLQGGTKTRRGILFEDSGDRVFADVYAPAGAKNVRGYVLYLTRAATDLTMTYNCCNAYLHTGFLDTLRKGSPTEMLFDHSFDSHWQAIHLTTFTSFGGASMEDADPEDFGFILN